MKKMLLLAICLVYVLVVSAGSVTEQQALQKARQFMPGKSFKVAQTTNHPGLDMAGDTPYYIFNAGSDAGFVIVSGDDRTKAILGYSDEGTFDFNNLPENVAWWLGYYADVISSLSNSPEEYESSTVRVKNSAEATTRKTIEPMVQSKWGQGSPYNEKCVFNGTTCLTGCVATAMAQIVNYHKYPKKVAALDGYVGSKGYTTPDLPAVTLDWKNICTTYSWDNDRTDTQKAAVATLMRYCGQSVEMDYGPNGSSTVTGYIAQALMNYFGYDTSAKMLYRDNCESDDEWEKIIYQELAESRPVVYRGRTNNSGHAFIVDGYENGLYHVNWGWGGSYDGHFVLTIMDAKPDKIYSNAQGAVIGIKPLVGKVKLNKTKANLEKGKTLTLKATVSPEELLDKSVTWKSSDKKIATVTSTGKVKAINEGTATITCTSEVTGAKSTCKVTVGSVSLNKSEAVIKKGKTITLKATVTPTTLTDKSVTWESSDEKVATVTSAGKVKGVKTGTTTITCTSNATGLKASCKVTIGLVNLNKYKMTLKKGKTEVLTPAIYPSSLTDKSVTWTSSDKKVATVTSKGKVKAIMAGTATITCTSVATGLSRTCEVTVGEVSLDKSEVVIKKGKTLTLKATVLPTTLEDKSVTWESSDTKIATVSTAGKVKGVKVGTATITCTSNATGLSTTCSVIVTATSGTRSIEGGDDDTIDIEMMEDKAAAAEPYDVYDLSGRKVLNQTTSLDGLPTGVYIVNGRKLLKK